MLGNSLKRALPRCACGAPIPPPTFATQRSSARSVHHSTSLPPASLLRLPIPAPPYRSSRQRRLPIPPPRDGIDTPAAFLKAICRGRGEAFEAYAEKLEPKPDAKVKSNWHAFWSMRGPDFAERGVSVTHRRCAGISSYRSARRYCGPARSLANDAQLCSPRHADCCRYIMSCMAGFRCVQPLY